MRILVLSKYDRLAASSRYRFLQYQPYLAAHGIELVLSPLFDDDYLAERFASGRKPPLAALRGYGRRLKALLSRELWDLAIVHSELFPYLPGFMERALQARGLAYVYDYDDAIFHMYDAHRVSAVRAVLGRKLAPVLSGARAVMAGNRYLVDYASKFNPNVHLVPTVVDMQRYGERPPRALDAPFTVAWIGSLTTSVFLKRLIEPLAALAKEGPVRFIATGASPIEIPGVEVDVRAWSEEREVRDLQEADVGVMPMPDEPWTRGKCAFKLIQYMAAGLPTVASPVGANEDVVTAQTGLFARTPAEWVDALRRVRDQPDWGRQLGAAGRERVQAHYSLQSQQSRIRDILEIAGESA